MPTKTKKKVNLEIEGKVPAKHVTETLSSAREILADKKPGVVIVATCKETKAGENWTATMKQGNVSQAQILRMVVRQLDLDLPRVMAILFKL